MSAGPTVLRTCVMPSPVGSLVLAALDEGLCLCAFSDSPWTQVYLERTYPGAVLDPDPDPAGARSALEAYFAGDLELLDALSVAPAGTAFQRAVWDEVRRIPAGQTLSYGEIARRLGRPPATRAVGAANGQNPVALVIPCHRVVGATGKLTGYGGGLSRKRWLLAHESSQMELPAG